jgi:hypothetical protein
VLHPNESSACACGRGQPALARAIAVVAARRTVTAGTVHRMAWRPGHCRARMVTARGQRLARASAKQRGITFPDGTGRAGQYRSGLSAAADTVLSGGSASRVVMSNRGQMRAWAG